MNLAIINMIMGGGASTNFIDSFNGTDGPLLNNWLYTGDWSIVGGKLIGNPATTGSNLIINGDFETGNPPTGWNAAASNSIEQNGDVRPGSAGSNSAFITVGGSAFAVSRTISLLTAGRFYQTKFWGKRGTNTQFGIGNFGNPVYFNGNDWGEKILGEVSAGAVSTAQLLGSVGTFYLDDYELRQLVTSNVFTVREFQKSDVDVSVKISRTQKQFAGLALCLDDINTPTDYILVGIAGYDISAVAPINTVRVSKVVGGVYTLIYEESITYVPDAILRVVKNGAAIKVYYNGIEVRDDVFVSDIGIVNNTIHGLFTTGNSVSFDDFQLKPYSGSGLDETPVFTRVSETTLWSTSGAKDWLGWPQLIKISSTRWIMTYVASTGHIDNDLTTTIHIRFSDNEGATWTNENTKLGGGAVTGFPMMAHDPLIRTLGGLLIICPNGDLLFHQYDNTRGTYQWRSTDDGDNWTDEGRIQDDPKFISLDDYKIDGSDIYITVNYTNNTEPWINRLYKSSDNGATWVMVSEFETDGDECGLIIAPNGDFIIVMRDHDLVTTYQWRSTDKGLTWGPKTPVASLYKLQRPRMVLDGANGIILHGRNYLGADLQNNVLYYSNDNGITWSRRFFPYVTRTGDGNYNGYIIKDNGDYYMISYSGTKTAAGIKQFIFRKS